MGLISPSPSSPFATPLPSVHDAPLDCKTSFTVSSDGAPGRCWYSSEADGDDEHHEKCCGPKHEPRVSILLGE